MNFHTVVMIDSIESSMKDKLNKLSSNLYAASICQVSQKLRNANEAAYTPRSVSIGPIHRELPQLQAMEAYKLRFFNNFLSRFAISLNDLIEFAAEKESFVRGCYGFPVYLSREQLTDMILLDGIFIVELFLQNHFFWLRDRNEIVFSNHWMHIDFLHDLLLLENQLPIRIMDELLEFVDFSFLNKGINLTIYKLAHKFFKDVGNTQKIPLTEDCYKARHFVEFLLILHAPLEQRESHGINFEYSAKFETEFEYSTRFAKFATELHHAGVTFRSGEGICFLEVSFSKGVLTIPELVVNDTTETFFRNLIAFEKCGISEGISSYVTLMGDIINTRHDVDLLVKSGIIKNELLESQLVVDLFNNLHREVVTGLNNFYFDKIYIDLNKYNRDPFHKFKAFCFRWMVKFRRDYVRNPWSFITGTLLLFLTIIQTICSILQVK